MGALVKGAALTERALSFMGSLIRSSGGARWMWPGSGGDRGPPGSWQMNANQNYDPLAMTVFSAVYASVSIISADIAKLPVRIIQCMEDGEEKYLRNDPYELLFRKPNGYQTRIDFIQLMILAYLIAGNSYILLIRDGRNVVKEMHVLDPRSVYPYIAQDGSVFYKVGANALAGLPSGTMIPSRNIIHLRLPLSAASPLVGVTPIYAAASSTVMGIRILQASQKFFANQSRPSGTLTSEQKISPETAERLNREWDANFSEERIGRTAVLGEGLKWAAMTINAIDAQLIEQLRWSVEDVARVFRVPPYLLGDMSKVTYRNTEQAGRAYISGCIGYHILSIQEKFETGFGFEPIFKVQFDLREMLKTEIDTRYTALKNATGVPWMSVNEARRLEGFAPVTGGEKPLVQSQNIPIGEAPPEEDPNAPSADPSSPNYDPRLDEKAPEYDPNFDPSNPEPPKPEKDAPDAARISALIKTKLAASGVPYGS